MSTTTAAATANGSLKDYVAKRHKLSNCLPRNTDYKRYLLEKITHAQTKRVNFILLQY